MDEALLASRPRCGHCGEVIGVYEPLVVEAGSRVRDASLTKEPQLMASDARLFHRACYELLEVEGEME
jgi:hypothetical protein